MAITMSKIEGYLDDEGILYQQESEDTLVVPCVEDDNRIIIIVRLLEDGEYLRMRTLKHLDDAVAEAPETKRQDLLAWMLNQNYSSKLGAWEYDPTDHDHHIAIGHAIEDGDLTQKQFLRLFRVMARSLKAIPEMKQVLGVDDGLSEKEKKKRELLAQLQALDEEGI